MWVVATSDEFDAWFAELGRTPEGRQAMIEVAAKVELLKTFGPKLGRPHVDTLNGSRHANMKELRAATGRLVIRIAFAFDPERRAILLTGGNKSGVNEKRFYKNLLAEADAVYSRHLAAIKRKRK